MQHNEDADIDDDKYTALNDWVVAMQNIIPLIKNQIIPEQRCIASTIESAFFSRYQTSVLKRRRNYTELSQGKSENSWIRRRYTKLGERLKSV